MLTAGDEADGPSNGKDIVVKSMILEANRIQNEMTV